MTPTKVSFNDFLSTPGEGLVLVDLNTVHYSMRGDYDRRNGWVQEGKPLCKWCDGTGNELFCMYRECPMCRGSGTREECESDEEQATASPPTINCTDLTVEHFGNDYDDAHVIITLTDDHGEFHQFRLPYSVWCEST